MKVYGKSIPYNSFKAVLSDYDLPEEVNTTTRFSFSFSFKGPNDDSV